MKKLEEPEKISIQDPDDHVVVDVYRRLPRIGRLLLKIKLSKLSHTMQLLENTGFCAIYISPFGFSDVSCHILAYKGKQGPCYDTGRKAIYTGAAIAALDDDNHLLLVKEEMPVCEKTANVYSFSPYRKLIRCSSASADHQEKLKNDPETFNFDNLEENLDRLYNGLKKIEKEKERVFLFYPGPFKSLILNDGSIVRRGKVNNIPESKRKILINEEKLFDLKQHKKVKAITFQNEYPKSGAEFLMESYSTKKDADIITFRETDFTFLNELKTGLKIRLVTTIKKRKKFFILTGTEPEDRLGCCPSEEVEEANKLVRAGILSSYSHSVPTGTCPVTTYSFKDEMQKKEGHVNFNINPVFREQVFHSLKQQKHVTLLKVIKWILIAFILFSVVRAIIRITGNSSEDNNQSLYERLAPVNENQMMIVLFHFRKRCELCLTMERFTTEYLEEIKRSQSGTPDIQFKKIVIDDKDNLDLVKRYNIFTSTLLIVDFEKSEVRQIAVLEDAWKIVQNEPDFREMLKTELNQFKLEGYE